MDNVFVLYDRASETVWYPSDDALEGVGGKRKGESIPFLLKPEPMTLGEWLEAHPASTVLLPTEKDVRSLNRPYLGVRLEDVDAGAVVTSVSAESPAAEAGFSDGDVLLRFADRTVEKRRDLREILVDLDAGDTVEVVVEREGEEITLRPTLASRSAH